jgi:hypothetical protein
MALFVLSVSVALAFLSASPRRADPMNLLIDILADTNPAALCAALIVIATCFLILLFLAVETADEIAFRIMLQRRRCARRTVARVRRAATFIR